MAEQEHKSIFTKHIDRRNKIVKNKDVLLTSYMPGELPHRMGDVDAIATVIAPAFEGDKPSNIMIFGKPGTGKTAVMNFIGKEMKKEDPNENNCSYIYVNCEIVDTQYGILCKIGNDIIANFEKRMPFTGWSLEKVYSEMRNYIDGQDKVFVVVLDEVDRLAQKGGDDVLYHLSAINDDLKYSKVSLVCISNKADYTDSLEPRVKSRLCEEKLLFHPYDAKQLDDILRRRGEIAFEEGTLEEGVIPLCAALSAQESGDARKALALLRIAAEIAERRGDNAVAEAHVRSAKARIELDTVSETVKSLTHQSKTILMSIVYNTKEDIRKMTTGDVYSKYVELCDILSLPVLTQRRVTDLISELDMLGIIHAPVRSYGRQGRTKEIELSVPAEICDMLSDDECMLPLKKYKPRKQTTLL
ncbi:MAG: orc1/cdc6 family replication initiation protein [Methanomassiliicoccaceae archaeon]|nr:orc1/cdc6 family replication initiation protein [Methanomassiliicoccaceae archaeon]